MRKARVGLLVAAALVAVPLVAAAQPKGAAKADPKKAAEQPKEVSLDDQPADQPATPEGGEPAGGEGGEPVGGGICDITPEVCQNQDFEKLAKRPLNPEMYAVQQIYALRYHRFEVNLYGVQTLNDQFVGHPGGGLGVNWYISNVLAVGVNGNVYGNAVSSFNFQTSRSARVGLPITEYQWNANVNFSYVPAYGKFAGFGDFIFHYDFYVVGGVGAACGARHRRGGVLGRFATVLETARIPRRVSFRASAVRLGCFVSSKRGRTRSVELVD